MKSEKEIKKMLKISQCQLFHKDKCQGCKIADFCGDTEATLKWVLEK